MESLVPAFIAALVLQFGDRPAMLAAILADRFGRPLVIALAAGLAHLALNGLAALAASAVAPVLTPNAQALMLAVALVIGGIGMAWRVKPPKRLEDWRLGSLLTGFLGTFSIALGDATQFFTFAIAARGMPWFAAAGAALGAFAIAFVAALLGELTWRQLPFRLIRTLAGLALLAAGAALGAGALRLY